MRHIKGKYDRKEEEKLARYTDKDKVYTDASLLDEITHNLKLMLNDCVLKDVEEALANETPESIAGGDVFVAAKEGHANFVDFKYTPEMFKKMNKIILANPDLGLHTLSNREIADYVADSSDVPKEYRPLLIEIASEMYLDTYEEKNNYYRKLNGQKPYQAADFFVDPIYISSDYLPQFVDDKYTDPEEFLINTPITEFPQYLLSLMETTGVMDKLIDDNPKLEYLRFLGAHSIDIYRARKAERFELLYLADAEEIVRARFQDLLQTNRAVYLKRYYSQAYKFENDYYDKFMIIMLIMQTANDLIAEIPEWYIRREVFDVRTAQYLLESHGIKFFPEIPLKYQISMVRAMNTLIKYKSTTKNIFDIAKVFFLKNVEVYKYYILKVHNIDHTEVIPEDLNGGKAEDMLGYDNCDAGFAGTESSVVYDGGTASKSTNFVTGADLDKKYKLEFKKVPVRDTLDNYLHNTLNTSPYDTITTSDDYWDGTNNHTYVRQEILKKDFTAQCTKYLSLGTIYSASEYMFQIIYFINLLMNNPISTLNLEVRVPVINADTTFNLKDLIILLICFSFKYYENQTDDLIMWDNRDPHVAGIIIQYDTIGDYDPENGDLVIDGRYAADEKEYWNCDGGVARTPKTKMTNVQCGYAKNPIVDIDWPETDAIIFDPANTDTDFDALYVGEYIDMSILDDLGKFFPDDYEKNIRPIEIALINTNADVGAGTTKEEEYVHTLIDYGILPPDTTITSITLRDAILLVFEAYGATITEDFKDSVTRGVEALVFALDGGYAGSIVPVEERETSVYDGGYAVNSYLYTGNEDTGTGDPCIPYKESFDKFRYPYVSPVDRIMGFNMEANLDELNDTISSCFHPKFGWLRGYDIREILPSYTLKLNTYETIDSFPNPGVIGELYEDLNSGLFYMWGVKGYNVIRTLYSKGIQDFMVPDASMYNDETQLVEIFKNNKEIYDNMTIAIRDVDTQDELYIYEYVYDYLFTMRWDMSYFTMPMDTRINNMDNIGKTLSRYNVVMRTLINSLIRTDNDGEAMVEILKNNGIMDPADKTTTITTADAICMVLEAYDVDVDKELHDQIKDATNQLYKRYTDFMKNKDGVIYSFYDKIMAEENLTTRQYNMATYIDTIIASIEGYLATDGLDYIFYFVPTVSWGIVLKYVSLVLNFFKSYKTHILDVGGTLQFDDRTENTVVHSDNIMYMGKYVYKGETPGVVEDVYIEAELRKDEIDQLDRGDDRIFFRNDYDSIIDLNGGYYNQNYWSLDLNAGYLISDYSHYAGTTSTVEFDGGDAWGIDITTYGDYDPERFGNWDCNCMYADADIAGLGKYWVANGGFCDTYPTINVDGKDAGTSDRTPEETYEKLRAQHKKILDTQYDVAGAGRDVFNDFVRQGQENYDSVGMAVLAEQHAKGYANSIMSFSEIPSS